MKTAFLPYLISSVIAVSSAVAFGGDEKPPDEVFERSNSKFLFEIPASFGKPVGGYSAYLATDAGNAPIRDLTWKHDADTIVLRWMVVPDAVWQLKTTEQMFAGARDNMLTDKHLKLISERDYELNGSPAHSFIFAVEGDQPEFQRMDYILTKPDLNIVMFISPKKAALEDVACKKLFESLSIGPKAQKK